MSSEISKSTSDLTLKVFEHKNMFSATSTKLPPCIAITEDEFLGLDFEYGIPHLFNDFVKYMTNGLIDPHEHYK